jgi:hypothetical protein
MENFNLALQQVLQSHEKNVSDLINQEITQFLLANFLLENAELNRSIDTLYQQVYLNIAQDLQDLFFGLIMEMNIEWEEIDQEEMKQNIQFFVNKLISDKKTDLESKTRWIQKWKKTSE